MLEFDLGILLFCFFCTGTKVWCLFFTAFTNHIDNFAHLLHILNLRTLTPQQTTVKGTTGDIVSPLDAAVLHCLRCWKTEPPVSNKNIRSGGTFTSDHHQPQDGALAIYVRKVLFARELQVGISAILWFTCINMMTQPSNKVEGKQHTHADAHWHVTFCPARHQSNSNEPNVSHCSFSGFPTSPCFEAKGRK